MHKKIMFAAFDAACVGAALAAAFLLRGGAETPPLQMRPFASLVPLVIAVKTPVFILSGFYSQLWCYASMKEGWRLLRGVTIASLILGIIAVAGFVNLPMATVFSDWLLTLLLVGGSRFVIRGKADFMSAVAAKRLKNRQRRAIVIGAGQAGSALIKQLQLYPKKGYLPVALLDDDPAKKGLMVHGVRVVGTTSMIPSAVAHHAAEEVILAIPSASGAARRRLALQCAEVGVACKTVPDVAQLVDGKASLLNIQDVDIKELLGRKETMINLKSTIGPHKDKTVLVTGAAGSIGSEICRQMLELEPAVVIGVDISENGLYLLEEEIHPQLNGARANFEARVVDVKSRHAVERLFKRYNPDIIFHAAAYKHVPMMERHLSEAIENNVLGTQRMIEAAERYGAERFALISTDKAVNPACYMGLSKQLAERAVKTAAHRSRTTKFIAVRFGNVIGSNGSVIPKFKRQICDGQPVTVTDPNMTRYFMTIHEAVYLVIHAAAMGRGGEVLILDVGEPVRIIDLARSMIRLSGLEPERDIPIKITGLRPGEKLCEELAAQDEDVRRTAHPKIFHVHGAAGDSLLDDEFFRELEALVKVDDELRLRDFLARHRPARAA